MTIYKIKYEKRAKKFIEKQSKDQRLRIYKAINNLPNGDVKKIKDDSGRYRLRIRRLQSHL